MRRRIVLVVSLVVILGATAGFAALVLLNRVDYSRPTDPPNLTRDQRNKLDQARQLRAAAQEYSETRRKLEARQAAEKSSQLLREVLGEEHPEHLEGLNHLAEIYFDSYDWSRSLVTCEKIHAIQVAKHGEENPKSVAALLKVARATVNLGRVPAAIELYQRVLSLWPQSDEEDFEYFDVLYEMSQLSFAQEDFAAARPGFEKVLEFWTRTKGEAHADTADVLEYLGVIQQRHGEFEAAKTAFQRVLEIRQQTLGDRHLKTARAMNKLGVLHFDEGEHNAAKPWIEQSLAILEEQSSPYDTDLLINMILRGQLHNAMEETDEAVDCFNKVYELAAQSPAQNHRVLGLAVTELILIYTANPDFATSKRMLDEAIAHLDVAVGPDHPTTLDAQRVKAMVQFQSGRVFEAEQLLIDVLARLRNHNHQWHRVHTGTLDLLAEIYASTGNIEEAIALRRESLETIAALLGEQHPAYIEKLAELANFHAEQQDRASARPLFEKLIELRQTENKEDPETFLDHLTQIAWDYGTMCQDALALDWMRQVLQQSVAKRGKEDSDSIQRLINLGDLHDALDQVRDAERCYTEAAQLRRQTLGETDADYRFQQERLVDFYEENAAIDKAIAIQEHLVTIIESMEDVDVWDRTAPLERLADLRRGNGELDRAEELYRRTQQILFEQPDDDPYPHFTVGQKLAELRIEKGDYSAAENLFDDALTQVHPQDYCDLSSYRGSIDAIAAMLRERGQSQRVDRLFQSIADQWRNENGEETAEYAYSLWDWADFLEEHQEHDRAQALLEQAVEIIARTDGTDSYRHGRITKRLARHFRATKQFDKSIDRYLKAVRSFQRNARDNEELRDTVFELAEVYVEANMADDADAAYQRWITLTESNGELPSVDDCANLTAIGRWYARTERGNLAESTFLIALDWLERSDVLDASVFAAVSLELARLYRAQGDLIEAERQFRRAEAMFHAAFAGSDEHLEALAETVAYFTAIEDYCNAEYFQRKALRAAQIESGKDDPPYRAAVEALASLHDRIGDKAGAEALRRELAE